MNTIADLLFEAHILKKVPRSGFHFLGMGQESVAEHSFMTAFIALTMARMEPEIDGYKLLAMSLLHDLAEARTGDLNYVHKKYVSADEGKALGDALDRIAEGASLRALIDDFNEGRSREARLARDADQIALILDLKAFMDMGYAPPKKWLPAVLDRLQTQTGRKLGQDILATSFDHWWLKNYIDRPG